MQSLRIEGRVEITLIDGDQPLDSVSMCRAIADGTAQRLVDTTNILTDIGIEAMVGLFGGGEGSPVIGGNAYSTANILAESTGYRMKITAQFSPTDPAPADTVLEGTVLYSFDIGVGGTPDASDQLLIVTYPALGKVRFSGTIPKPEQNGRTFTEEGLFTRTGVAEDLLARTTFSVDKTGAGALQIDHTFTLTRKP